MATLLSSVTTCHISPVSLLYDLSAVVELWLVILGRHLSAATLDQLNFLFPLLSRTHSHHTVEGSSSSFVDAKTQRSATLGTQSILGGRLDFLSAA